MAPEVFRHEPYNHKVDVYSFAMICYQLFQCEPPFWWLDPVEAARSAALYHKRPKWPPLNRAKVEVPEQLKSLVERCWHKDYEARPEFEDIIDELEEIARGLTPTLVSPLPSGQSGGNSGGQAGSAGGKSRECCALQ